MSSQCCDASRGNITCYILYISIAIRIQSLRAYVCSFFLISYFISIPNIYSTEMRTEFVFSLKNFVLFFVVSSWKINTDRTEIWYFLVIKIYLLALSSQCISESNKLYHWVLFSEPISLNILSRLLFQFFLSLRILGRIFFFFFLIVDFDYFLLFALYTLCRRLNIDGTKKDCTLSTEPLLTWNIDGIAKLFLQFQMDTFDRYRWCWSENSTTSTNSCMSSCENRW